MRTFVCCSIFRLLSVVLIPWSIHSQSSYVRQLSLLDFPTIGMLLWDIKNNENGALSIVAGIGNSSGSQAPFYIIQLNSDGGIGNGYTVSSSFGGWTNPWDYQRSGDYHAVLYRGSPVTNNRVCLFVLNFETGNHWSRQVTSNSNLRGCTYISTSGRLITFQTPFLGASPSAPALGFSVFDLQTGVSIWDNFYKRVGINNMRYIAVNIQELPGNNFSILGSGAISGIIPANYLLKLSSDGVPVKSVGIVGDTIQLLSQSSDESGNIYLAGSKMIDPESTGELFPGQSEYREGFIAKLDANYNVLWSKRLTAEQFPYYSLDIKAFPDGHVVFTYVTYGNLPVVSGKISPDGELLWYRGYEFYRPKISLGADTSIYFVTNRKYFPDGTWETNVPILAKTDSNGDIEGCPQFAACLSLVDMPLPLETWEWTQEVASELPEIDVEVVPVNFATTPYCGTPTPPSAEFSLPDTVCQFTCLSPDSLQNRLSHYRQWRLTGPGVDTLFADSTFSWCYHVPGRYTVEQEIWLLGCSEFYSRSIEILADDLVPPLGEDRSLCDTPYELKPVSNRPLRSFLWSDGSTASSLNVPDSGVYSLLASDGYCNVSDTVALRFVRKELSEPPLDLGPDTTLCPILLPYILRPQSPYSDAFFLNDASTPAQEFALSQAGNYTISTLIEDCLFSETLQLEVEPCPVSIYLPNSFSPNDDGINDRIVPQGEDYNGIRLEVYDRWGGLRHQSTGAPFDWDGKSEGKPLGTGVYVVVFYYQNLRSLQAEHIAQDVLLIR